MTVLGTTFADYSLIERISQGGMADIFLAADANRRQFTLRILLPHLRFNWSANRRFRWGCEVNQQLDHTNVVHCYSQGKFRGRRFAVLEYVNGGNLKEAVLRNDPQLRANQLKLLTGMAAGLVHIHGRGFLHLDFKPENVLLTKSYDPKIVDFDLAIRRPERPQRASKLAGTPAYLAPEQIMGQPVDERADIFAFGVTAYEMLSGKKPISGDTPQEVIQKYARFDEHLRPLRSLVPELPRPIERVVGKCLEKDVERRYPSMALVVRDLQT